jgi:nitrile hydratase
VLREFGLELPERTRIAVWDASAESRYMVVPRRPEGTEELSEEQLVALVTRKGLIGTAAV